MTLEKIEELQLVLVKIRTLAEAQVVKHDKGPEHEPSEEMQQALAVTTLASAGLHALEAERIALTGEVRWLDWGF